MSVHILTCIIFSILVAMLTHNFRLAKEKFKKLIEIKENIRKNPLFSGYKRKKSNPTKQNI